MMREENDKSHGGRNGFCVTILLHNASATDQRHGKTRAPEIAISGVIPMRPKPSTFHAREGPCPYLQPVFFEPRSSPAKSQPTEQRGIHPVFALYSLGGCPGWDESLAGGIPGGRRDTM